MATVVIFPPHSPRAKDKAFKVERNKLSAERLTRGYSAKARLNVRRGCEGNTLEKSEDCTDHLIFSAFIPAPLSVVWGRIIPKCPSCGQKPKIS